MQAGRKIFFASDLHLGIPNAEKSLLREKKFIQWLNHIQPEAKEIYLLGDLFDFWFEYKHAVPKGYVRVLAKLAELVDAGIPVHVFTGNHDMWMFDYLPTELGIILHRNPIQQTLGSKNFIIGHGDGLGPGDHGYKLIKKVFASPFCQWLFARIHPNIGMGLANFWSKRSRRAQGTSQDQYLGDENEFLVQYCKIEVIKNPSIDFFVFGHRHLPIEKAISDKAMYYNLGDWIRYDSYGVFDTENNTFSLKYWPNDK